MNNPAAFTHQIPSLEALTAFRKLGAIEWAIGAVITTEPFRFSDTLGGAVIENARYGAAFVPCGLTVKNVNNINEYLIKETPAPEELDINPAVITEQLFQKMKGQLITGRYESNNRASLVKFNDKVSIQFIQEKKNPKSTPVVSVHSGEFFRADIFSKAQCEELFKAYQKSEERKALELSDKLKFLKSIEM